MGFPRTAAATRVAILLLALGGPPSWGRAAAPPAPAASSTSAAATRARLAKVRTKIADIARDQQEAAAQRDAINTRLAEQARRISDVTRAVRDSDAAIAARTQALAGLQARHAGLKAQQAAQRTTLIELLRAAYALERGAAVPLLLDNDDIARAGRVLAYARYFQRDLSARIQALRDQQAKLENLRSSIASDTRALEQQRATRRADARRLAREREHERKLLAQAEARIASQKDRLASLQQDAKTLDRLLKRLQDVFADIPATAGDHPAFARLRGTLALPVAGTLQAAAGSLAHGIVISASPGAEVHAVAYGRVAWADFMRGYGMLVIVDQGDGWMSLYGGNEAALVAVGDWVRPGQPLATVGRGPKPGQAWFGLRHDGQAVDPHGWFAKKP